MSQRPAEDQEPETPLSFVPIQIGDIPVCVLALKLLKDAVKKANKAVAAIACSTMDISRREVQCTALLELFQQPETITIVLVPGSSIATLRAGVALEFEAATKLREDTEEMLLPDDDASTRIKQLGRILAELDVAGLGATAQ